MILGYRDVFRKMEKIIQKPADSEVTIDEWLDALDKLYALRDEIGCFLNYSVDHPDRGIKGINLGVGNSDRAKGIEDVIERYGEYAYAMFDLEAQHMNTCAWDVGMCSVKIIHEASKDNFEYKDVSEYIRNGWNQLVDFYSCSGERMPINSYSICFFNIFAALLEDAIRMVADRLKGQENYYDRMR